MRTVIVHENVPALSVVMPVYNGMPHVEESVASILEQTFDDFEFVIGDDGSSDGTSELLLQVAARDRRIKLIRRESPSGLISAANWVVSEARAPIIAMAHADDRASSDRLAREFEVLQSDPQIHLVGTLWHGVDEQGRYVRPADYWRLVRGSSFAPFSHSSIMFRRCAFERAGGYRAAANYWEDLDLYYRIARGGRIAVIPEVLSAVRHTRISTRLRDAQEQVENMVDLMFRTVEATAAGSDPELIVTAGGEPPAKLHPMTFVSCGSTMLWSGRSPGVAKRMWARARIAFNLKSLHALLWVGWGTMSPKTLRLFLRTLRHIQNGIARPLVSTRRYVEWSPYPKGPPTSGDKLEARSKHQLPGNCRRR